MKKQSKKEEAVTEAFYKVAEQVQALLKRGVDLADQIAYIAAVRGDSHKAASFASTKASYQNLKDRLYHLTITEGNC